MRFSLPSYALFLISVTDTIREAFGTLSKFAIVDNVFVNRSANPIRVSYNQTALPIALSGCHVIRGNFSVDSRGHDHPNVPSTSLDFFKWTSNQLTSVFRAGINWSYMTTACVLQMVGQYANQSFLCNNSGTNLAVFYSSSFPYRKSLISFINGNGSAVICETGTNGFFVAGYEADLLPPQPTPPFMPTSDVMGFNPLWAIPLAGVGTLLLIFLIPKTRQKIVSVFSDCCSGVSSLWEERRGLLEMTKAPGYQSQDAADATVTQQL